MDEKLVCYHLYYEEASCYMEVCIQLFNKPVLIFNENTIFIHMSLSSQWNILIDKKILPLQNI